MAVARVIEVSATSERGFEAAIQEGIERANKTLRHVTSAWVKDMRVNLEEGRIRDYQVNLLITFILDD
jgi:flavin-binding protein dodecin